VRKALELEANPRAAIAFRWLALRRQVRVEGPCARLEREASERYFAARDRESQLTTVASAQSRELVSLNDLEARIEAARAAHVGRPVPCPPGWGGMVVRAERMEFWEGGAHRRHRRSQYERREDRWDVRLLYP
jgi:pyridoxamine 5'-phosphate oxidase